MKNQKILVTGAGGFVGTALCRRLLKRGFEVYGLGRHKPDIKGLTGFFRQDITRSFSLDPVFDCVIHLAGHNVTYVGNRGPGLYRKVNVLGTEHVIKAVKSKKFIFLSTAKIYAQNGIPIKEDSPVRPQNNYEKSKFQAELKCRSLVSQKKLVIIRSVNIVGPGQKDKAILPVLFKKARAGKPFEIFMPRDLVLQFLFVEDVVEAILKFIVKDNISGTFNLASKVRIRLDDLAFRVKERTRCSSEVRFTNRSTCQFSEIFGLKAEKTIHWKAKTSLDKILKGF